MSTLFVFAFVPLAILVMGLLVHFFASKLLGEEKGRIATFALLVGYLFGRANQQLLSSSIIEFLASVAGLVLLWWFLSKRVTANG